ncbi:hypothetical protein BVRB_5g098140 [Beta vulgaris subsp. vulgaris]|nr:hypothetical protein BVRB_5g098140 [Beta vulgaris subsp. vulgaris]
MPSSAQESPIGECWERFNTCTAGVATAGEFQEQCCPVLTQDISNERECFCGIKPQLQNATNAEAFSQLLTLCSVTASFDALCPVEFQEAPCWEMINNCIGSNVNNNGSEPRFNPSSPLFNSTEFLCCPLMQQITSTERQCFCTINTFIKDNPSHVKNTTDLLSVCGIANSAASLGSVCSGQAPSPAPVSPPQAKTNAASNIAMTGSLSSLLVLVAYIVMLL